MNLIKKYPIAIIGILIVTICFVAIMIFQKINGGKNYTLELDANNTTGYLWNYEFSDENIVKVVKDTYETDAASEGLLGAGGTQIYEFKGLNEGTVTVTLTYQQVSSNEVAETKTIDLIVDKNLNVKEKSE